MCSANCEDEKGLIGDVRHGDVFRKFARKSSEYLGSAWGDRPLLSLGFPPGVLFDMLMRGGPLPDHYDHLRGGLVNPGQLDFSPEEAVVIREWLQMQPDDVIDVDARDAATGW